MKLVIFSAAIAVALTSPIYAQTMRGQSQENRAATAPPTQSEKLTTDQFLNKAWNMNQFEIQLGKEAENKASSGFQDYARMILDDHTKMNDELKALTQKSGMQLPNTLDNEHQAELNQLKSASDRSFDKQFRAQQIKRHQQALRIFQSYASNGDNADLRSFAQNAVATLQRHLDQAEKLSEPSGVM
jgi:putative membrane protein